MADLTNIDVAKYVVEHIDEAIEKEWIKVYYQPVIRAITEELCSTESLARWVDPNIGFLPPDSFIGVLETSNLIHKLDCYIVRKVCKDMHDLMAQNLPVVPVSVNFSRLDFIMCDMLKVVEDAVEENDIPRDFIHVEITESMIVSDEELMSRVINQFRNAGYEVWMDDFGSGYSSLTLLKDYQFDLLKMDMRFLSTFNDKSKSILRSTITMAKDIGIKTLAEGVETKEHFQFLRDNGCDKIQGYYFGKPEPIQDMMKHMEEKGIPFEKRQWKHFYEIASFHVRNTDVPLHIVFDDGTNFKSLFMNEAFRSQIGISVFDDYREVDKRLHRHGSPLLKRYREMANTMEKSGNLETFYYTESGNYLKLEGMVIAKNNGCYIISAEIHNITATIRDDESRKLDTRLRELNALYETVLVINIKNNNSEPLLGRYEYVAEEYRDPYKSLSVDIEHFTQEYVFPSQRERYCEFMDMETLQSRIEATESGHIEEAFRIKQENGNYEWREVTIMQLPHTNSGEYLYCLKTLSKGLNLDESFADGLQWIRPKKSEYTPIFGKI
jgi:EAL domain-containing protein (putative c-di-GMP-specific phosphodiesterase class I)